MDSLERHLDDAWKLFDRACRHLKGRAIDDVQIELYDLAFSLAELVASRESISAPILLHNGN
jgi:hypothetical protein